MRNGHVQYDRAAAEFFKENHCGNSTPIGLKICRSVSEGIERISSEHQHLEFTQTPMISKSIKEVRVGFLNFPQEDGFSCS
jgi:hypothetical protein